MACLSLGMLVAAFNSFFVAVAAVATLLFAVTVSLDTIQDNAELALMQQTNQSMAGIDLIFNRPHRFAKSVGLLGNVSPGLFPSPNEDPSLFASPRPQSVPPYGLAVQKYLDASLGYMRELDFAVDMTAFRFFDQTFAWIWLPAPDVVWITVKHTDPAIPRPNTPTTPRNLTSKFVHIDRALTVSPDHPAVKQYSAVDPLPAFLPDNLLYTRRWENEEPRWGFSFMIDSGKLSISLAVTAMLGNRTDTYFGEMSIFAPLIELEAELSDAKLTANSLLLAADRNGFLIATSEPDTPVWTISEGRSNETGCFFLLQDGKKNVTHRGCRHHVSVAPHGDGILPALLATRPALITEAIKSPDPLAHTTEEFFTVAIPIRTLYASGAFVSVVAVVPVADVVGEVGKFKQTSIWVAGGAVAVLAVVTWVVVAWLLAPLSVVAGQMEAASRFQDPEALSPSCTREVSELQEAFGGMAAELRRIAAFVPQSLLHGSGDQEEDADLASVASPAATRNYQRSVSPGTSRSFSESQRIATGDRESCSSRTHSRFCSVGLSTSASPSANTFSPRAAAYRVHRSPRPPSAAVASDGTLVTQSATVLVVNLVSYVACMVRAAGNPASADKDQAAVVQCILDAADFHRGVIDSFHGDRFLLSFNVSRPAAGHTCKAAQAAVAIKKEAPLVGLGFGVTGGLASGRCRVGTLGCSSLKRVVMAGSVVPQALALERLCHLFKEDPTEGLVSARSAGPGWVSGRRPLPMSTCLAPASYQVELATAVTTRVVDLVRLPFRADPVLIMSIDEAISADGDDEWMYLLPGAAAAPTTHEDRQWRRRSTVGLQDAAIVWGSLARGNPVDPTKAGYDVTQSPPATSPRSALLLGTAASSNSSPVKGIYPHRLTDAISSAMAAKQEGQDPRLAAQYHLGRFYDMCIVNQSSVC